MLRTFPKHKNDANFDPEASGDWVGMKLRGAAHTWFNQVVDELACVHGECKRDPRHNMI